jgi:hypothetical protein
MDFHSAAFTLRVMAVTIMLLSLSLRASKIFESDTLIVAVALGMAMLSSAAVFCGDLTAFACLFTAHVLSVMTLQCSYGALPLHPVRAYRRMRGMR